MREIPNEYLERLREVDPDADVFYMGEDRWLLGTRQNPPGREEEQTIRRSLGYELTQVEPSRQREAKIRLLEARLQGFRMIQYEWSVPNEMHWPRVIEEFRERTFKAENQREEAWQEAMEIADTEYEMKQRKDTMLDYADSELDYLEAWGLRGRRNFMTPGIPGGN